jgi:RNA-dependent RNA polymerase
MLGAGCEVGEDLSKHDRYGFVPGYGQSHLAFDFTRELFVIKSRLKLLKHNLPAALRPLDAELSFDDITSQGIHIIESTPRLVKNPDSGKLERHYDVTVTISMKRPPRFFTDFEQSETLFQGAGRSGNAPYRRRATAMDFAIGKVVSSSTSL